jgi:hypothetical protein
VWQVDNRLISVYGRLIQLSQFTQLQKSSYVAASIYLSLIRMKHAYVHLIIRLSFLFPPARLCDADVRSCACRSISQQI